MKNERALAKIIAIGFVGVIGIEVIYWIGVAMLVDKPDSAGTFGDMFGALNTAFAGLAFVGVIYTLHTQITEAAEARRDQAESLRLVQNEVSLLREDIDLQRRRDMVEAGPFFRLTSASISGRQLYFGVENVGAPVIVKAFDVLTPHCSIESWSPSTLPTDTRFTAPCFIPSLHPNVFTFRMSVRDRWGALRSFELVLRTHPTGMLDFREEDAALADTQRRPAE